jgi:hypothetical protein
VTQQLDAAMGANRGGEVHERVELLQLARACDRRESGDGDLAVMAARAEHDLPSLQGGPERALGRGMPRAGLCRVAFNGTRSFEADLGFAVCGVAA